MIVTQCPVLYGYDNKGPAKIAAVTNFNDVFGRQSYGGKVLPFPGAQGIPVRFTLAAGQELEFEFTNPGTGEYDFSLTHGAVAGPTPPHIDVEFDGDTELDFHNVQPGAFAMTWRTPGGIRRAAPVVNPGSHALIRVRPTNGQGGNVWLVFNYTRR